MALSTKISAVKGRQATTNIKHIIKCPHNSQSEANYSSRRQNGASTQHTPGGAGATSTLPLDMAGESSQGSLPLEAVGAVYAVEARLNQMKTGFESSATATLQGTRE